MKKLKFEELEEIYSKTYFNAVSLVEEAEILFNHEKYARAYSLSHLAREEFGKLIMLLRYIGENMNERNFDLNKLKKRILNHKEKLKVINLIIYASFSDKKVIEMQNILKNASLYAGYDKEEFVSPIELINRDVAASHLRVTIQVLNYIKERNYHEKGRIVKIFTSKRYNELWSVITQSLNSIRYNE